MVPPRLTVVPGPQLSGDGVDDEVEAGRGSELVPGEGGSIGGGSTGSPVHGLIASIETATSDGQGGTRGGAGPLPAAEIDPATSAAVACDPERQEKIRVLEAVLFAATEPLAVDRLALNFKSGEDVAGLLAALQADYAGRGVNLVNVAGRWVFRTAENVSWALERHASEERRLSRAALETLAIVAYHQPVTRAEIEEVRGVTISKGTLDVLMETGWVRPRGRRRAPGKPITYGTTEAFLSHFGLDTVKDLPGLAELKGAGLLDANLPPGFMVPEPSDVAALMPDELPLDAGGDEEELQSMLDFDEEDVDDELSDDRLADVGERGGNGPDAGPDSGPDPVPADEAGHDEGSAGARGSGRAIAAGRPDEQT